MPAVKPEIVVVAASPVAVPEGLPDTVQLLPDGNPLNATLPVFVAQVG